MRNRVVVTGMGAVTPFGAGAERMWQALRDGRSAIGPITSFDVSQMPVKFAGEVREVTPESWLRRECPSAMERGIQMSFGAAAEALRQARLIDANDRVVAPSPLVSIIWGSGLGPCFESEYAYGCFFEKGPKGVRPTTIPKSMFNSASSLMSIYFGLTGGNQVVSAACASGTAAIGQAFQLIRSGLEQAVLCGGGDSPLCASMFAAWTNLRVLARHESPEKACRPFDRSRNGLVLAEGAGALMLESLDSARERGAPMLAEVIGYGASSDARHITEPSPAGQKLAIERSLHDAGIGPERVDYINAHGTGTQANDTVEAAAIRDVFGPRGESLPVTSTKSMLGHSLGASGALEAVTCVFSLRDQFVCPTLNCEQPDPELGLDYVPHAGRTHAMEVALSNSFAFGGNNAVLLVRRPG
jgi:3-oxoacyl-[acyl-carrier-protein] synthase II